MIDRGNEGFNEKFEDWGGGGEVAVGVRLGLAALMDLRIVFY